MKKSILLIIIVLFAAIAAPVSGQRSYWYSGDLLTSNQLQCISEDSQGFLWIGTEYGLNRFDGYQFTSFYRDDTKEFTLSDNYVRCMSVAGDGNLWIGTGRGLQLLCLDREEFHTVSIPDGRTPYINQILVLHNGDVWFIASGYGLCRITDTSSMQAEYLEQVTRLTGTRNHTSLIEDSHGVVWIGTNSGVYQCNPATLGVVRFGQDLLDTNVTGICEDNNGDIFISTRTQVFKWNRGDDSFSELYGNRPFRDITHLFTDRDGTVYVALRGEGLRCYDAAQNRLVRYDDKGRETGLNRLDVSAFYMDTKENVWLGCYLGGLMLIPNGQTQFKSFRFQDYRGLQGGGISSMMVDGGGNLWTGFNNNPVTCFDRNGNVLFQLQDQPYVSSMFLSRDGTVWAGLYSGGMARLDTGSGLLEHSIDIDGNSQVQCITQDKDGNLYYSTRGTGFSMYNPKTHAYRHWSSATDSLESDWINTLAVDIGGTLWIGHNSGLNCVDTRTGKLIKIPSLSEMSGVACSSLLCDADGRVWAGTGNGLFVFDAQTVTCRHLTVGNGLSNNNVCGLASDVDGNVWCSTSVGLNRINPENWKVDRFYSGSGLIDKNYYMRACASDKQGSVLYFGSGRGITFFNPGDIDGKDNVGNVVLTAFYLNDVPIDESTVSGRKNITDSPVITARRFRLSDKDNSFTLEFSTFDYGDRDCISYEYSFNQNQWNTTPAGVNRITFTHLSSGRHQLSVRACCNNSYSEISNYTIIIGRPWYLSLWAVIAYILIITGVSIVLIYNVRQRRQKELSDAKLHSFTNVAHELCSPLTMVISPLDELLRKDTLDEESRNSLEMMHKSSAKILNLLNQLLDIRKYDEGQMRLKCRETNLVSFIQGAYEMFMYSAGQHNIKYSFSHSVDEMLVWIDRDRIEKVISNLLSNAFKYTPDGGEILVELTSGTDDSETGPLHHYAEVSVVDSGIGLDVDDVNKVFDRFYRAQNTLTSVTLGLGIGLNYSRILVEMHRGVIQAQNRTESQGSRFWFRLPLGNTHLRDEEIDLSQDTPFVYKNVDSTEYQGDMATPHTGGGYKVLVIDDDESMLDYVSYSLKSAYYKVVTCRNGKEGLRLAISQKPDLIVSDVVMPEMDGISFVRALRKNPNISHIPVILLSARNEPQDRIQGIETGADAYLPKPFYVNELKLQVRTLINNRLIVKGKYSGGQEQRDKVEVPEVQSSDDLLMGRIMDAVNKNLQNPDFSVEELADTVGVSRTQLHRKVKNITGLSAGRFIHSIKMRQAAALLSQGGISVAEVSDMVGFSTKTHFATAFKTFYGISPSEYMRQHVSGETTQTGPTES